MGSAKVHPHVNLIREHADCQAGMYLNGTYRDTNWFGGFSEVVSDFFWNFVSPIVLPGEEDKNEMVYEFFKRNNRVPALYGETGFIEEVADQLSINEYDIGYQDVWMEYTEDEVDVEDIDFDIKDIRGDGEVSSFVEVFKKAYGDANADDPYGGLPPTYIEALKDGFATQYLGDYDTHLVALDEGKPVSIGSIIRSNDVAIIYNMGTVPDRQGEGIGSYIADLLINDMFQAGVNNILLQTEPGSYVQEFYADMGFEKKFEASAFIGGSWEKRFK
jgi:GNAT superfamily N-acetyltransferase